MRQFMIVLVLLVLPCVSLAEDWKEIKSQDGSFTAKFPAKPEYSKQSIDTDFGKTTMYMLVAETDNGSSAYLVMYNDYAAELFKNKTTQQLLDDATSGAFEKGSKKFSLRKTSPFTGTLGAT
ncbi:MAG: hypothetical protein ACKVH8_11240 [Pirellulales bacterium]